ncbi:MAG: DNA-3-methyladenine glycosylase [Acidimicrobiales bacterium]|nr:DNA-3-methyladenine glycosylase [Acidimicrobiales bacterium]
MQSGDKALAVSSPRLSREFYAPDAVEVAPRLLNKVLVHGEVAGRIIEVEAYMGPQDPASHAYGKMTQRNRAMFGPPGHLYVYFTYGMHWCINAVCGPEGFASAVLIRALEPLAGLERMWERRTRARKETDLCSGPAKLSQALGLEGSFDGADLVSADRGVTILDDGVPPPLRPATSGRIGVRAGKQYPWRWFVPGNPHLSRSR